MLDQTLLLIGIGIISFVVGLSGAMMPGPLLAIAISESSKRGVSAGPLLVLGHAILESALVAAVALGLAELLSGPITMTVVSLVGSIALSSMGLAMIRSCSKLSLQGQVGSEGTMHPVLSGIFASLANPYWTLWWATVGVALILQWPEAGWMGVVAFTIGHLLSDLAWYSFVSFGVARGRKFVSDRVYRWAIAICGLALVGFGTWFAWKGGAEAGGLFG